MTADSSTFEISLEYLAASNGDIRIVPSPGGGDQAVHQGEYSKHAVTMHNGRGRDFDLDHAGFRLLLHQSKVADFYNDDVLEKTYQVELRALLLNLTGAREVEVFDHTRRSASLAVQQARGIREPAATVHNDYSATSGPQRLGEIFADQPEHLRSLRRRRFAIIIG